MENYDPFGFKFALASISFRAQCEFAKEQQCSRMMQRYGYTLMAHQMLHWFHDFEGLQRVTIRSMIAAPTIREEDGVHLINHQIGITLDGAPFAIGEFDGIDLLPWKSMGFGTFFLDRKDPRVARMYEILKDEKDDDRRYELLVLELALAMDDEFSAIRIEHEVMQLPDRML